MESIDILASQLFFQQTLRHLALEQLMAERDPIAAAVLAVDMRTMVAEQLADSDPGSPLKQAYAEKVSAFWRDVAEEVRIRVRESLENN